MPPAILPRCALNRKRAIEQHAIPEAINVVTLDRDISHSFPGKEAVAFTAHNSDTPQSGARRVDDAPVDGT